MLAPNGALTFCGTLEYLAPEMLLKKGHGTPLDMWAFGCLVFEMLVGQSPFYTYDQNKVHLCILSKSIAVPEFVDPLAVHLIKGCLHRDPAARLTCKDVKNHPWFQTVDWEAIYSRQVVPSFLSDPIPPPLQGTPVDEPESGSESRSPGYTLEGFTYTESV